MPDSSLLDKNLSDEGSYNDSDNEDNRELLK